MRDMGICAGRLLNGDAFIYFRRGDGLWCLRALGRDTVFASRSDIMEFLTHAGRDNVMLTTSG